MTDRWKRVAPLSGVAMVALVVAGIAAQPNTPGTKATGAHVIAFYTQHRTATRASEFLMAFAAAAAILYYCAVSRYLRSRGSDLLATTTVIGSAVFAAALLLASGLNETLADQPSRLSTSAAQALNLLQNDVISGLLFAGFATATLSMGVAMLRTHALPRPLAILTVIVGVGGFSVIGSWFAFMLSGILTLFIAGYTYREMGRPAVVALPDVPGQRVTETAARDQASAAT